MPKITDEGYSLFEIVMLHESKIFLFDVLNQVKRELLFDKTKDALYKLSATLSVIDDAMEATRKIEAELRFHIIDDLGLFAALEWKSGEFKKSTGISCKIQFIFAELAFSKFVAVSIVRIYEEILSNIALHAEASVVKGNLAYTDGNITFTVEDNGQGFDSEDENHFKKAGLGILKARVASMNGTASIVSEAEKGAKLELTNPFLIE